MGVDVMGRTIRRIWPRKLRRWGTGRRHGGGLLLSTVLGIGLALLAIHAVDAAIRPLVEEIAKAKLNNAVTTVINGAVERTLADNAVTYDDIVSLRTDESGYITAMTTNSVKLNTLRTELLGDIVMEVDHLDSRALGIPLGDLTGFVSVSDRGPKLPVRVLSVATPEAVFRNVFTSAGINQTQHRVMLDVSVTVKLLLPGGMVETVVDAQVCVAETVIVGQVPDAYLELPGNTS